MRHLNSDMLANGGRGILNLSKRGRFPLQRRFGQTTRLGVPRQATALDVCTLPEWDMDTVRRISGYTRLAHTMCLGVIISTPAWSLIITTPRMAYTTWSGTFPANTLQTSCGSMAQSG